MSAQETIELGETVERTAPPAVVLQRFVRGHNHVTLYNADCLDLLPIQADAVISDPPYGISNDCNYDDRFPKGGQVYEQIQNDDKPFDPTPWLKYKIVVLWGANNYAEKLRPAAWLVWQKTHQPNPYYSDAEIAWMNKGRMVRIFRIDQLPPDQSPRNGNRPALHPTQKPIALMCWSMELAKVPEGATVLDPYMGSGTTGIACLRTNRNFIGIEKDPNHFKTACARLEAECNQGALL